MNSIEAGRASRLSTCDMTMAAKLIAGSGWDQVVLALADLCAGRSWRFAKVNSGIISKRLHALERECKALSSFSRQR